MTQQAAHAVPTSSPQMPVLNVEGLTTAFFSDAGMSVAAVRDVTLTIGERQTVAIVGESGSGKSATALSVMRLLPPHIAVSSGAVWFGGRDLLRVPDKELSSIRGREIAMVFQDPTTSLNPLLPVGAQISAALRVHLGMTRARARDRVVELLSMVGIPDPATRASAYPHELSGGMCQRVMIALALSCQPKMLIADEPTTALDVTIQAQILDLIQDLQRELHLSVLLITHDLGIVAGVADHVYVMYAGRVVESGATSEIFSRPQHPYTVGLLNAVPRLDRPRGSSLAAIPGQPAVPGMVTGCAFRPRCERAMVQCHEDPELEELFIGHQAACWAPTAQEPGTDGRNRRRSKADGQERSW